MRVEVAERPDLSLRLVGFRVTVGPLLKTGDTVAVRVTVPANVFMLVTLIVDDVIEFAGRAMLVGLAETMKSGLITVKLTMIIWNIPPALPLTAAE